MTDRASQLANDIIAVRDELYFLRERLNTAAARLGVLSVEAENMIDALHDSIRRPMGVVQESAEQFVGGEELANAESRRGSHNETDSGGPTVGSF
tara:strand:- start:31 stop:315 length:285 start_codon:yes stop_codon:yes gene_type:complete